MKTYDVYGIECVDLDEARSKVERVLGVTLVAAESGYHCGDYYRHKSVGEEHFILQRNYDAFEDEWTESKSREQPFLLYVSETNRSSELRKELEQEGGVTLIRHEVIQ